MKRSIASALTGLALTGLLLTGCSGPAPGGTGGTGSSGSTSSNGSSTPAQGENPWEGATFAVEPDGDPTVISSAGVTSIVVTNQDYSTDVVTLQADFEDTVDGETYETWATSNLDRSAGPFEFDQTELEGALDAEWVSVEFGSRWLIGEPDGTGRWEVQQWELDGYELPGEIFAECPAEVRPETLPLTDVVRDSTGRIASFKLVPIVLMTLGDESNPCSKYILVSWPLKFTRD